MTRSDCTRSWLPAVGVLFARSGVVAGLIDCWHEAEDVVRGLCSHFDADFGTCDDRRYRFVMVEKACHGVVFARRLATSAYEMSIEAVLNICWKLPASFCDCLCEALQPPAPNSPESHVDGGEITRSASDAVAIAL